MSLAADEVTLRFPRSSVPQMLALSQSLTQRMHQLLERNADGKLSALEREELETLVEISQFGQILSMSLSADPKP